MGFICNSLTGECFLPYADDMRNKVNEDKYDNQPVSCYVELPTPKTTAYPETTTTTTATPKTTAYPETTTTTIAPCPQLSQTRSKCGPNHGRCVEMGFKCNSQTGYCSAPWQWAEWDDDMQPDEDKYDNQPVSCYVELPPCLPLSPVSDRCGPLFGNGRCAKTGHHCNSRTGECGTGSSYEWQQYEEDKYDFQPANCQIQDKL